MRKFTAGALAFGMTLAGACGGDDEPPSGPPSAASPDEPTTAETEEMSLPEVQAVLDEIRFTDDVAGMSPNPDFTDESGLQLPTLALCLDDSLRPGEDQRIARSQQSWSDGASGGTGGFVLSTEIALYRDGGSEAALDGFAFVPQTCPTYTSDDGTSVTGTEPVEVPADLPVGSVAHRYQTTLPNGEVRHSLDVAIPSGDVVAFLWLEATSDPAGAMTRFAPMLAERLLASAPELKGVTVAPPPAFCDGVRTYYSSSHVGRRDDFVDDAGNPTTEVPWHEFDAAAYLDPPPDVADAWATALRWDRRAFAVSVSQLQQDFDALMRGDLPEVEAALGSVDTHVEASCGLRFDDSLGAWVDAATGEPLTGS